jgi:hypothetical protein
MTKMRITKRQLKRIIKEEKARILAEQKIRRTVRRRLMEQAGAHVITGEHGQQKFSVQLPDPMANELISAHQAGDNTQLYDLGLQAHEFIDGEVAKQTGTPVHAQYGIDGHYDNNGTLIDDVMGALSELL